MALTHTSATRSALADQINSLCNAGTSNPSPQLVLLTSSDVPVATLKMADPAFPSASNGAMSANAIQDDTNATGGAVAEFRIEDRNGNEVLRGTVTTQGGGGDVELTSTTIGAGDTVTIDELTYTAPA